MTFNDDANLRGDRVRRRGRTTGIAVGGGGLGVVAIVLIAQLLGVDVTQFVGGGGAAEESAIACETGRDANENIDCRIEGAALSLDRFWLDQLPPLGTEYQPPEVILFDAAVSTACGSATSAVGPFYCPPDQNVYIDTAFYDDLRGRFGAQGGPFAEMYVVAHEFGHHVQNQLGLMERADRADTGPSSDAVRLELQADCFAGAWAGEASEIPDDTGTPFLEPVTDAQLRDALDAASVIGDDRIQESTQGQVNPETWTHGTSEQRQRWFREGYGGGVRACDTFAIDGSQL